VGLWFVLKVYRRRWKFVAARGMLCEMPWGLWAGGLGARLLCALPRSRILKIFR
jgi:hypothetical protein